MTFGIINPQPEQQRAWKQKPWSSIIQSIDRFRSLFSGQDLKSQRLNQRVTFSDQAQVMLEVMNTFDLRRVLDEIIDLTYNPSPAGHKRHWRNSWLRFIKSKYPFPNYHYMIEYEVQSDGRIAVMEIYHDRDLYGSKEPASRERNMLYNVGRGNGMKYDRPMMTGDIEQLEGAWEVGRPVPNITTRHAAVNGMQNNLKKASWLMGVHLDAAYQGANPDEYTLFHNPSEGKLVDFIECVWDKPVINGSHNAQHLVSVLHQQQKSCKTTEWVVHSQGAIIFNAALILHNRRIGTPLNRQRVAVHASGALMKRLKANLLKAQMELVGVRNNPFDLVPNLAGFNSFNKSGFQCALKFMGLVMGENGGNFAVSPHTLPYLGIENYQVQLVLSGHKEEAKEVRRYIYQRERQQNQQTLLKFGRGK
jgi:hypothetical protein